MRTVRYFSDAVKPKRLITGAGALAILVVLGACISDPVVFDESFAPEETARLYFVYLNPTSYNGIEVNKRKWVRPNIPQGDALFVVDINSPDTRGKDFGFAFNFEGDKDYCIIFAVSDDDLYGVNIYNTPPSFGRWPSPDTLIAFIPFLNQPDTITTTYR
jgi:hypothetical protein